MDITTITSNSALELYYLGQEREAHCDTSTSFIEQIPRAIGNILGLKD